MVTAELGACEWFVYELRRSNLIDRGQLDQVVGEFLKQHPRAEAPALSQYLVQHGILSQFQAERVLSNKSQGLVLGPYVLVDTLGTGSMGTVYKAVSKTDDKGYAVKVLPRRSMWNVRLARRQVRSFGQFNHPAVVPFVDVGTSGGMHYLVWPLIQGETLESLVQRQGKLPPDQVAQVGVQIANGLAASHQNGLFHGLLKPSNVMVGANNQVAILDFGIGSLLAENEGESLVDTMSTANTLTSGLDCASPESIMEPTNRTPAGDQYSLGCALYFCASGQYPFPEGSAVEKMMAHQFKQPTPLKELVPDAPAKLIEVVERLMAKKPDDRYRGADEVVEALQPLAGGLPTVGAFTAPAPLAPASRPSSFGAPTKRPSSFGEPAADGPRAMPLSTPPAYPPPVGQYPAAPAYPSAPGPQAVGYFTPGAAAANQPRSPQVLTRAAVQQAGDDGQGFHMPPGFVPEGPAVTQLSPLFYAMIGMGVMVLSYVTLMAFNPFR